MEVKGRTAIVTGGIGAAIARRLVRAGASVVVADRDAAAASTVAADLDCTSGGPLAYRADVADLGELREMVAHVERTFGGGIAVLRQRGDQRTDRSRRRRCRLG